MKRTQLTVTYLTLTAAVSMHNAFETAQAAGGPCEPHWDASIGQPGLAGLGGYGQTLAVVDLGDGPALYVGGNFITAGGVTVNRIAKWDGKNWSALGTGVNAEILSIVEFDDGSGPALYAGGVFSMAGGVEVNNIAKWDGEQWHPLGSGANHVVRDLCVFDDGSGPALYAGGQFSMIGGIAAQRIAKWDGNAWSPLGSGITGFAYDLHAYGDSLYVAGALSGAGGIASPGLVRWNGNQWIAGGLEQNSGPYAMGVLHENGSSTLFAGGSSVWLNGEFARSARYNGNQWQLNADEMTMDAYPSDFAIFNDGTGPAMYCVGEGHFNGRGVIEHVARWAGTQWESLGLSVLGEQTPRLYGVVAFDDGNGPALFVTGRFNMVSDGSTAHRIAAWRGCDAPAAPADLNGDGSVGVADLLLLLGEWGQCADCNNCPADLDGDCNVGVSDLLELLANWG